MYKRAFLNIYSHLSEQNTSDKGEQLFAPTKGYLLLTLIEFVKFFIFPSKIQTIVMKKTYPLSNINNVKQ